MISIRNSCTDNWTLKYIRAPTIGDTKFKAHFKVCFFINYLSAKNVKVGVSFLFFADRF